MAANQSVVDELVVKLTLDASEYKRADKSVDQQVDATEKKQQQVDAKRKKRDTEQIKRNKETLKGVKELALGLRSLTFTIGSLLGVGSAAGLVGTVVALAGMETNLRRATVSTGLSNRELQAWGSTARRLGADAQAGASAIADLAREQKQFNLTGNAPMIQAFARAGVRVGPDTSIVDILGQAQERYRQAVPAQRQQFEAELAAQGVSPDLIVAIKSEKNVREEYARSLSEASSENRKALDATTTALTSLGNAAVSMANALATVLQPYIEQFATLVGDSATQLSGFVDRVIAAGGGMNGFTKVLSESSPELASLLQGLVKGLTIFAQAVDLSTYGLKLIFQGLRAFSDWIGDKLSFLTGGNKVQEVVSTVGAAVRQAWTQGLGVARAEGVTHLSDATQGARLSANAARRVAGGALSNAPPPASRGATSPSNTVSIKDLAAYFVSQGMNPDVALGLAVNAEGETWKGSGSAKADAVNPASGASGLFQFLGARKAKFAETHGGLLPHQTSWQTQADFVLTDEYERKRTRDAVQGQIGVYNITRALGDRFEANGLVEENKRRARYAQQYALQTNNTGVGQQINIQSMTVQANSPQTLVNGITRQSAVQNYNSALK